MSQVFLLFFAVLISLSSVSLAQTNRSYLGFQAGPNLASLRGGDYLKDFFNPRIGFAGGFTYRTDVSKVVALATGVIIERKGRKADGEITNAIGDPLGDIKGHEHLDYLTVPLLARLNFGNKKKFFVNAGPYFGYLIKGTYVEQLGNQPKSKAESTGDYKRFDVGLTAGVGGEFPLNDKFVLSAEIRNNLGLYNIAKPIEVFSPGGIAATNDRTIRNNSVNLLFGFSYRLGNGHVD